MIRIEQSVGATPHLPPSSVLQPTFEGSTTLIILERDGTISHSPPDIPPGQPRRARVALMADAAEGHPEPSLIERVLGFAFDVLGISNLEVQVYETPQR
jgi:hypothetical protein